MQQFLQLFLTGISIGAIYSLVALALNLTVWTSRTMNFATGSLLMFAAMTSLALISAGLNLWLAILLGLVTVGAIGYVIELVGVRPILSLRFNHEEFRDEVKVIAKRSRESFRRAQALFLIAG